MSKTISEILLETRTGKGFNKSEMARKLGISSQLYGQYEKGEIEPKTDFRVKFEELFGVNLIEDEIKLSNPKEVIALGKHTPLRLTADQYEEAFKNWKGLPMFNTPVTASFVETYRDEKMYTPQYYLHDPRFRDCDFGAIITGDSMHSEIRHGDFIACKEITDRRFIVFGDIYYVVATNGLETCKYVNADPEDKKNLLLVPRNEKLSPSPIPKDMILRMYKVRGIIRGY